MLAIYKKEFKSYFISMIGYAFIAFLMLVVGFVFYMLNIQNREPYIGDTLSQAYISITMMVLVPVVTMKIFADERHTKSDQLLFTAPIKISSIVIGKYLAVATMFTLPVAFFCLYPLIISEYGKVPFAASYVAILGFWLMGLAYFAIGVFISSITENQIISAVATFATLLVTFMLRYMATSIPASEVASLICYIVIAALVALVYWMFTKGNTYSITISLGIFIVLAVAIVVAFIFGAPIFAEGIQKILLILSLDYIFSNFTGQYLDLTSIAYYISIIGFFLFLTVQSIQKRRWS